MIKLINSPNSISMEMDKDNTPEIYWESYRAGTTYKAHIVQFLMEINDNHVTIHFSNGKEMNLSHVALDKTVHPTITSNQKLLEFLEGCMD